MALRMRVSRRIVVPVSCAQPTDPLYRQCAQTEPRLMNTNAAANATRMPPCAIKMFRKLPPLVGGSVAAPSATITPPTIIATALPNGKADTEARKPCPPERDQRVKSAVMVPESMKEAMTRVTAAPRPHRRRARATGVGANRSRAGVGGGEPDRHAAENYIHRCGDHADDRQRPDAQQRDGEKTDSGKQGGKPFVPADAGMQDGAGEPGLEGEPPDDHRGEESGWHEVAASAEGLGRGEREVLTGVPGQETQRADVEHQYQVSQRDGQHPAPEAERVHDQPAKHGAGQDHRKAQPHR